MLRSGPFSRAGEYVFPAIILHWCARHGDMWPEGHKMASMQGLILAMFYRRQGNVESQVGCALWI